jgi:type I site-specific restriction endonuclease
VSILTTGFDEPTVESIILNRATKSLTLYFQMIGRGSRILPDKKEFTVIDLGNNLSRFGAWEADTDWKEIFRAPELHFAEIHSDQDIERAFKYVMPEELRARFCKSSSIDFDVKEEHMKALIEHHRPKIVIDRSIGQHIAMCMENSEDAAGALELAELLKDEIEYRVRIYSRRLNKASEHYVRWMTDEYKRKLKTALIVNYMSS